MSRFTSQHGGNRREVAQYLGVDEGTLLDFSANINPLGMPLGVRQRLAESLDKLEQYPDVAYQSLHQALAAYHAVPPDWIQAGNGETELIFDLVKTLEPKQALVVSPGFAEYQRALAQAKCQVHTWWLQESAGWQLDDGILSALTPELDCVFLCTPNNPTGLLPDWPLLERIAHKCGDNHIWLIVDEAFLDFVPQQPGFIPVLGNMPWVWVLRSMTKFYAIPGLRLGYALSSHSASMASLRAKRAPWSINTLAAIAGEQVLQETAYQQETWQWVRRENQWLYQALSKVPGIQAWQPQANYLFFRCDVPELDLQWALLEQAGILIRSCANYPGLDARYYRVAVKSHAANQSLLDALQQVMSALV